jgi:hypothetical protein
MEKVQTLCGDFGLSAQVTNRMHTQVNNLVLAESLGCYYPRPVPNQAQALQQVSSVVLPQLLLRV